MKYHVKVKQKLNYTETLEGDFDSMEDVQAFVAMVTAHFQNVEVYISAYTSNMPEEDAE